MNACSYCGITINGNAQCDPCPNRKTPQKIMKIERSVYRHKHTWKLRLTIIQIF